MNHLPRRSTKHKTTARSIPLAKAAWELFLGDDTPLVPHLITKDSSLRSVIVNHPRFRVLFPRLWTTLKDMSPLRLRSLTSTTVSQYSGLLDGLKADQRSRVRQELHSIQKELATKLAELRHLEERILHLKKEDDALASICEEGM